MENQIVCPNCKATISNKSIIDEAVKGEGSDVQYIHCECGERITYWKVKSLLREQQTFGAKFHRWIQSLSHSQG